LSVYLDTQVVTWLSASRFKKLPAAATRAVDSSNLLISPMVLLELEYLHEIGRTGRPAMAVLEQLEKQLGLIVSDHLFLTVAQAALYETWTRDPFDRIIVAHARSDGYSKLVSSDEKIKRNYSMTIWD
jgi:PIN domain nuclease of toxin-antitoxin system